MLYSLDAKYAVKTRFLPPEYFQNCEKPFIAPLVFRMDYVDFEKIFGPDVRNASLGSTRQAKGEDLFKGIEKGDFHVTATEDGWLFVYTHHHTVLSRFIEKYEKEKEKGAYNADQCSFRTYLKERAIKKLPGGKIKVKIPRDVEELGERVDVLLAEGQEMWARHKKMDEAFKMETSLDYLIRGRLASIRGSLNIAAIRSAASNVYHRLIHA